MHRIVLALIALATAPVYAAGLQPKTVAAFERYVQATERRLEQSGWAVSLDRRDVRAIAQGSCRHAPP